MKLTLKLTQPLMRLLTIAWIIPATMACGTCGDLGDGRYKHSSKSGFLVLEQANEAGADLESRPIIDNTHGARLAIVDVIRYSSAMHEVLNELEEKACAVDFSAGTVYDSVALDAQGPTAVFPVDCASGEAQYLRVDLDDRIVTTPAHASIYHSEPQG